jgi:hypothetical protein
MALGDYLATPARRIAVNVATFVGRDGQAVS